MKIVTPLLLPLGLVAIVVFALTLGRYPVGLLDVASRLGAAFGWTTLDPDRLALLDRVIVEIRLPRIAAAVLVGAAISSSGSAFQAVFRNPLVSPGILGVLGGASFGAALGILLFGDWLLVQICAFAMGLVAVAVGAFLARLFGDGSMLALVLGGMISGAFFASALAIVKYVADPYEQLPAIVYWMMGSLGGVNWTQIDLAAGPILAGIALLAASGRALDALSMGDDEARALGVPVGLVRCLVIVAATLISALSVSLAGMIGWLGLVVPHVTRLLLGPANTRLVPASALIGAIFLVGADCLSRTLTQAEIPIGILTELLGIPIFVVVLGRARKGWA
jgi:iron complex transport system permease protein